MVINIALSTAAKRLATPALTVIKPHHGISTFGRILSKATVPVPAIQPFMRCLSVSESILNPYGLSPHARGFSKKSESDKVGSDKGDVGDSKNSGNIQHQTWVKFQQGIAVDGFDTGAVTTFSDASSGVRRRGGKALRKRMEKMRKRHDEAAKLTEGQGVYPAARLSEEETQKLLAVAYSYIPERTGPRRSRHKKRMAARYERRRQYHAKKKTERIAAHYRRHERQSRIAKECREVRDTAGAVRAQDEEYQKIVLQRWAAMHLGLDISSAGSQIGENSETGSELIQA